jgi:hypothetical protein
VKLNSTELIEKLEAGEAIVKTFYELRFGTPYVRFTDADIDLYLGGELYLANGTRLESVAEEGGLTVAEISLSVPNADRAMSSRIIANEYRGSIVKAYIAALETYGKPIDYKAFFFGRIDDWHIKSDRVVLKCTSEMIQWQEKHNIKSGVTCWKPYGSSFCGHTGQNCNQTYEQCAVLGNEDNFGGSRWLPEVAEQELWWGRVPS